jgi:hypothetical protein
MPLVRSDPCAVVGFAGSNRGHATTYVELDFPPSRRSLIYRRLTDPEPRSNMPAAQPVRVTRGLARFLLPVLHHKIGFWQFRHLPCLGAAAVPVDLGVAERHQTQGEVTALKALRVPAHSHYGHIPIPDG